MYKAGLNAACNTTWAAAETQAKGKPTRAAKGKVYLAKDGNLEKLQTLNTESTPVEFVGFVTDNMPSTNTSNDNWEGWMAITEEEEILESKALVDWKEYTKEVNQPDPSMIIPLNQNSETALVTIDDHPFFVDSGAMELEDLLSQYAGLETSSYTP
ncbi:hypothetical protein H2248_003232 [Termitomyces sp. 'cryptogamus']|nr:hypothetical protein H2248_003232 [Termitomyces sp. 'cryptogamus']